jgi:DNA-binding GntR family transcriptional regulator
MSSDKLAALLDDLIERDPDVAERLIEKHLGRLALKKRLQEFKAEKQDNCQGCQTPRACEYHGCAG